MNTVKRIIKGAKIVNEGKVFLGDVVIVNDLIHEIKEQSLNNNNSDFEIIDAKGLYLIPGVIDDQVHFRDPGITYKGDIYTESRAAVAGGITSFMDMPNTIPNCLTQEILQNKYDHASTLSIANYSFYMGASNDNLSEVVKTNPNNVCGIKIFMGSSTGNMLVDNNNTLEGIFSNAPILVAVHCEDEETIKRNTTEYYEKYGDSIATKLHPEIRSSEACYLSSSKAVSLAKKHGTRLHVLHLTTAKEMELFSNNIPLSEKKITAEACIHHLWFSDKDYDKKGNFIKWNPAIKSESDREALIYALHNDKIDVIATDHAPHSLEEKQRPYFKAPSGGPMVQHALPAMLEMYHNGVFTLEKIVEKMCHNPSIIFNIEKRGFIRKGYKADLTLLDLNNPHTVTKSNILYKCGWSPMEGQTFKSKIKATFVNGNKVYDNGVFNDEKLGERLTFNR
ncbi:MAG: dihydroorotase [Lentimicrobiaceae bacterium]|jgi:dihydroorotase|nr:dihydroorotase [Lentimicrobiaceae bacterium]|tara:strand:- start:12980 stop:14329 length:1350 start_codon:yes stop_codon:yes gene_type:complete